MRRRPTPGELWNSAPWHERLGMTLYLAGSAYAFLNGLASLFHR